MRMPIIVTAANPHGEKRSHEENQVACEALCRSPLLIGYPWFRGEGRDPAGRWPPEPSLLVFGLREDEGIEIGRAFGQNAIVVGTRGEPARLAAVDLKV